MDTPDSRNRLEQNFKLHGKIMTLGKQTAKHPKTNLPENGYVLSESFQETIQTFMHIFFFNASTAAWVFWEALWEITTGMWLCFKSASIFAAQTEIKRKQHHYLAGFSIWFQQGFSFFCLQHACLPSLVNKNGFLAEPEPNMKHGFNVFVPFLPGSAFIGTFWFAKNMCTSSFERPKVLLFDDLKSLSTFNCMRGAEKWTPMER